MTLQRPDAGWLTLCEHVVAEVGACLSAPAACPIELSKLGGYLDQLVAWNARLDLTAARNVEELVDLFIADAALLAHLAPAESRWLDVGTGAGAPGLVLKLMRPDLGVRLVEPKTKRVTFMRTALATLGVPAVEVTRSMSEQLPGKCTTWAVSRATLAPPAWLAEGARLAEAGVWVLLAQAEVPELPRWQLQQCVTYRWPLTRAERRAALFVPTPNSDS